MTAWSDGYVTDVGYSYGYFYFLAPDYLRFLTLLGGSRAPSGPGLSYCELGCGQGYGLCVLAAANPDMTFHGYDFSPGMIAHASQLAADAALDNVTFEEASFEDMAEAPADRYPDFDFIVLHGVYSWVSPFVRADIVRFIRRHLKPGGIVFVSYNAQPARGAQIPMQRLIMQHAKRITGRSDDKVRASLSFVNSLMDKNLGYFEANRFEPIDVTDDDLAYLTHEYIMDHWHPMFFSDVVSEMASAKLDFVSVACMADQTGAFTPPPDCTELSALHPDEIWRQLSRDIGMNRGFRRDIFQRGRVPIEPHEAMRDILGTRLCRSGIVPDDEFKVACMGGKLTVKSNIGQLIAGVLEDGACTIDEIRRKLGYTGDIQDLLRHLAWLVEAQFVDVSRAEPASPLPSRRLNRIVAENGVFGKRYAVLASPVTGGGVRLPSNDMVLAHALIETEHADENALIEKVADIFVATGRQMTKDGVKLSGRDDLIAEIRARSSAVFGGVVPRWRGLGIIE